MAIGGSFIYPDSVDDYEKIKDYAEDVVALNRTFRHEVERAALRNILNYIGIYWIKYDPKLRFWRPQGLKKSTPRPVTNRLAMVTNTAVSNLVSYRVPISFGPASYEPADVAAANVADRINDIIERESHVRQLKPWVARWTILTGNAFVVPCYDTSREAGVTFVQSEQCAGCGNVMQPLDIEEAQGVCPECPVDPAVGPQPAMWSPAVNPETQEPVGVEYPKGRFYSEVKPIFSCYFDNEVPSIQDSEYFLVSESKGRDWVSRTYGEDVALKSASATHGDPYSNYVETLAYSTSLGGRMWGSTGHRTGERARVRRLWLKPHPEKAPGGIYAVMVGDQVIESKPWPYHDEKGTPFLNVVHFGFDQVPGRLLHKSRVDDVAIKQDQRNRIEAIIELHAIRMANSVWLLPEGSGVSRITGEQGQYIKYNPMGTHTPTRVPGDQVSPYLMQWLVQIDREIEDVMGLSEVSRGEAPKGVTAYAALTLLDERAQSGQSNLLDNWSMGWMEWSKQNLNIWREFADEERVHAVGEGEWAMAKFSRANLEGGVDVTVELGQNKPRSQVARRAVVAQAVQLSLANPLDPSERMRLLELIGLPELMEDFKLDSQRASMENDKFMSFDPMNPMTAVQPPLPWDNHQVHIQVHRRLFLSERFQLLPPPVQMAAIQHAQLHWMVIMEAAQAGGGAGSIAAKPTGKDGPSKGTADTEGGGEGGGADANETDLLQNEAQQASPDTNIGAAGRV